jgi:hypothetical protein
MFHRGDGGGFESERSDPRGAPESTFEGEHGRGSALEAGAQAHLSEPVGAARVPAYGATLGAGGARALRRSPATIR